MSERAAIVLAAGKSTRMDTDAPKVLHEICGRPMLSFVLQACRLAGVERTAVVIGHGKSKVKKAFSSNGNIDWVEQREQKGTGHAVLCCKKALAGFHGTVLVIAGDMPLVKRLTLVELMESRERTDDAAAMATTILDDPTGYGRIVRDSEGRLEAIVEQRDCSAEQLEIREVNPSYYAFDADRLFEALDKVEANPDTGEYYLTDVIRSLREAGHGVSAVATVPSAEAMGVNSRLDLAVVARMMQDRLQMALMGEGVSIIDPDNTWIEADVTIGRDSTVYPFSFIGAGARVGSKCRIGPFGMVAQGESIADGKVVGPANPKS